VCSECGDVFGQRESEDLLLPDGGKSSKVVRRACRCGSGIYPAGSGVGTSVCVFQPEPEARENTFVGRGRLLDLVEKAGIGPIQPSPIFGGENRDGGAGTVCDSIGNQTEAVLQAFFFEKSLNGAFLKWIFVLYSGHEKF